MNDEILESVAIKHTVLEDGALDWEIQLRTARLGMTERLRFCIGPSDKLTPEQIGNSVALGVATAMKTGYDIGLMAGRVQPQLPLSADGEALIDQNTKHPQTYRPDYLKNHLAQDKADGFRHVGPRNDGSMAGFIYLE